ncbi:hypothetical protein [Falsirhodobacter halotolerans]|uniref:hypothetical protein n=1 Tax=Falsirhodobacter halotolerans TaxID=1146892 RepID=UPI001FD125AC|nr:hypothetical protein [Falsirhodobacter halotolerans]MCJ8139360.1 hypothetical protein [Falsirhodobacter halotolerans]
MTEKTVVRFLKPYSRYNAGEVAGFDPLTANSLIHGRIAVKHVKAPTTLNLKMDTAAATEAMAEVKAFAGREEKRLQGLADGIQQRESEITTRLDAREADLDRREADLAARLAELDAAEGGDPDTADPAPAGDGTGPEPPNGATPPTGENQDDLPQQGTAKKGK